MNLKKLLTAILCLNILLIIGCSSTEPAPINSPIASPDSSPEISPNSSAEPSASDEATPTATPASPTKSPKATPKATPATTTQPTSTPTPTPTPLAKIDFQIIEVTPTKVAADLGLDKVKPEVYINRELGQAKIKITLSKEQREPLPENAMFKAWVIDNGKGEANSSASTSDTKQGRSFTELMTEGEYDALPFSQPLGAFAFDKVPKENEEVNYIISLRYNNNFVPYDKFMITIESDINAKDLNPRPGTPVWMGDIDVKAKKINLEEVAKNDALFYFDAETDAFSTTDNAKKLNIEPNYAILQMSSGYGNSWIRVEFDTEPNIGADNVMEAWLVDNYSNTPHNEKLGPAFENQDISDKLRNVPYAMSLGKFRLQSVEANNGKYLYIAKSTIALPTPSFDSIYITIESDGNKGDYDPRPGSELMYSSISH